MKIEIPPKNNFLAPEGKHPATCIEAREQRNNENPEQVDLRLLWRLDIPAPRKEQYVVGKTYEAARQNPSKLLTDLHTWLGHELDASDFETETLVDRGATVTVVHIPNEGRKEAFRWVSKVEPPMTETLTRGEPSGEYVDEDESW